jgi:outer membrane protein assembly factor BamB
MSEGIWTAPLVGVRGQDFTRSTSGTAVGTAGVLLVGSKLGRLYRLNVQNAGATAYFVQVFDTLLAPVNTAVPIWSRRLASSSELDVSFTPENGLYFANGLGIAISSTAGTLTLAVANDIAFFSALYTRNV